VNRPSPIRQQKSLPDPLRLVLVILCASLSLTDAQDELPPDASHMPDSEIPDELNTTSKKPELDLPSWGKLEPDTRGRLWPGNKAGTPDIGFTPELQLPPEVDPTVIPHIFQAEYFGHMPDTLLVDPQTLLTAHERSAVNRALDEHLEKHKLPIYILLFQEEQDIPEFQSLASVHATWFGDRKGIVVGFWLGAPGKTAVEFGKTLRAEFPKGLDQAFAAGLSDSYTKSYPFSQLDNFAFTFLWSLSELQTPIPPRAPDEATPAPIQIAANETEIPIEDRSPWIPIAAGGTALAITALGLGVFTSRRKKRHSPYLLEELESVERLRATYSGGSGAALQTNSARQNSLPKAR